MALGKYLGAGSGTTKALYHLNGNANDSSGNGYNGTATNVSWVGGIGGGSASFGGNSYVGSFTGDITVGTNFYAGAFFNCTSLPTSGNAQAILCDYKGPSFPSYGNGGFALQIINSSGVKVRCALSDSSYEGFDIIGTTIVQQNIWNYICLTYNGTQVKLYLNGKLEGTFNSTRDFGTSTSANNRRRIGVLDYGSSIQWFIGLIDEAIIETIAWTPVTVQKQYTYGKGWFGIL